MISGQKKRSSAPIKWHGGKTYLAKRIIDLIPDHIHYVEPFFGGGAVFFQKPDEIIEGHSEVINDVYGDLMNFWAVLSDTEQFEKFTKLATMTPFSKPVWERAMRSESTDPVERAISFFIRYRQSRQGLGRDFATMSRNRTRRGMNEQVSSWLSAIDGLPEAHSRMSRVAIYSEDAMSVIRREDGENTFFYCDPPYLAKTRVQPNAYSFEMLDSEHEALLYCLSTIKGAFLLSGYRNEIYDDLACSHGWHRIDIKIDNKASSQKKKPTKIESIWKNF